MICFLLASNVSSLQLNGMAEHAKLKTSLFVGALYLEAPVTSLDNIAVINTARRIELRITADSLSIRRFNRFWVDGMAINNIYDAFSSHTEDILTLNTALKSELMRGDTLVFETNTINSMVLKLNGETLATFNKSSFFDLLLNVWVGEVPPSSEFKSAILAGGEENIPDELRESFDSLQPLAERTNIVTKWVAEEKAAKQRQIRKREAAAKKRVAASSKPEIKATQKPAVVAKVATPVSVPEKEPAVLPLQKTTDTVASESQAVIKPKDVDAQEQNDITLNGDVRELAQATLKSEDLPEDIVSTNEEGDELEKRRAKNKRFLNSMRR